MSIGAAAGAVGAVAGKLLGKLDRAYLAVHPPTWDGSKAKAGSEDDGKRIEFLFNPHEFNISKSVHVINNKTATGGETKPVGPGPRTFSVEMFFDRLEDPTLDIVSKVRELFDLCEPWPDDPNNAHAFVTFGWGSFVSLPSHVTSVKAKFHMFLPGGIPLRATCTVDIKEGHDEPGGTNPTSGSRRSQKSHTLLAGETLATVAYMEYQKAGLWRAIAENNGIDDPMRLSPGTVLLIPPVDEAAAYA